MLETKTIMIVEVEKHVVIPRLATVSLVAVIPKALSLQDVAYRLMGQSPPPDPEPEGAPAIKITTKRGRKKKRKTRGSNADHILKTLRTYVGDKGTYDELPNVTMTRKQMAVTMAYLRSRGLVTTNAKGVHHLTKKGRIHADMAK